MPANSIQPRRWLVLAHCFNMDGRAASQTITDKLPLFESHGITPIIVSAATGRRDERYEHHQVTSPAPSGLRFEMRHILRLQVGNPKLQKMLKILLTILLLPFYLLEKVFIHLDSQWSWFIPATLRGAKIIREKKPEMIYATGGANSAFLAAWILSRRYGIPWFAEVHDPMVHEGWTRSAMALRWSGWLEGVICRHAKAAIWFTEEAVVQARKRHPELGDRGHAVLAGTMPPVFGEASYSAGEHLRFAHFGSLSPTRNLTIFFTGLQEVLLRYPEWREQIRIDIFGGQLDALSRQAMEERELVDLVVEHGRLENDPVSGKSGRQRILEAMRRADVLLLPHGNEPFCAEYIPSKTYEYFWTSRPILASIWGNPQLGQLLTERGHWVAKSDDARWIAAHIQTAVQHWRAGKLNDLADPKAISVADTVQQMVTALESSP